MNTDNIDKYGHCVVCHKHMIVEKVIDGRVQSVFLPEHDHTEFLLNNGSRMRVCICKPCKGSVDLTSDKMHDNIMEAVIKGWQLEVNALVADDKKPEWTDITGKAHMDRVSKLDIDVHSEGIENHLIEERKNRIIGMLQSDETKEINAKD